jgi:twinkle protein
MIDWQEIDLKGRHTGSLKTTCPKCSHNRKKKKDPCLSINIDKGLAKCWNCEEISVRDFKPKETKQYKLPPQEWVNYTKLSDKLVKWFKDKRGISQGTLIDCKVTEELKFQPAKGKEANCVVFNYFEGNVLVNKKYRTADKCFTQEKDAKKVFYGINHVIESDEVIIVEGELDKLAMWEAGYKNCISVPNGANDLNDVFENCETYLKDVKVFYIAVDMDAPGIKLENELAKRLGKHRCKRVNWSQKDANDELLHGSIDNALKAAKPYPIEGTFTALDVSDDIDKLYKEGFEAPLKPKSQVWAALNEEFSMLRSQLTVVTGIPSHGKSNIIEHYCLDLIADNDLKMSFYSPEHFPMQLHHSQLSEKVIGKPFHSDTMECKRMTRSELEDYKKWSSERVILTAPEKGKVATWDWVLQTFEQQIFRYGVDLFVIDAFNKVKRKNPDSLGEINDTLSRLTLFCQQHEVMCILIAHPTKMKKEENGKYLVPTLYDVKGSGDFYDQAHNGLTVYRDYEQEFTFIVPTKVKFKHQGKIGEQVKFRYCKSNGRYYPLGGKPNFESMIDNQSGTQTVISEINEMRSDDWADLPY